MREKLTHQTGIWTPLIFASQKLYQLPVGSLVKKRMIFNCSGTGWEKTWKARLGFKPGTHKCYPIRVQLTETFGSDNISVIWLNNHSHSFLFNNKLLNIYRHIAIKNNFIIYQELLTIMVASHRICSFHIRWNSFWNLFPYLSHVTLIPSSLSFTLNPSLKILKNRLHFQMYDVENFFTINDKTVKSQCSFNLTYQSSTPSSLRDQVVF